MASETRDLAPAVTRAIQILDALSRSPQPVKPSELASFLKLPKSSVHGICSSLLAGGLIERTETGEYILGLHIVDLANARLAQNDLAQDFMQVWSRHSEFSQEAVVLSELNGTDVIYLACRNSVQPLGVTFRIGMRLPATLTATGKAILSTLDEAEIDRLYGRRESFEQLTTNSVKSLIALKRQLEEARHNGFSIDNGETREGMCSFGAPVMNRSGTRAVAGIAMSFFRAQLNPRREEQAIAAVKDVASNLSRKTASMNAMRY